MAISIMLQKQTLTFSYSFISRSDAYESWVWGQAGRHIRGMKIKEEKVKDIIV